jgi:transposase, IS4 family
MDITFPEAGDQLEVIADATGISTNKGDNTSLQNGAKLGTQNSSR